MNSVIFTITPYTYQSLPFISAEASFSKSNCSFYFSIAMALIETQLRLSHCPRLKKIYIEFYNRQEFTIAESLNYRQQPEVRSLYTKILDLFTSEKSPSFKLLSFTNYLTTTKDCAIALEHLIKIIILSLVPLDISNQNKVKLNIYDSHNNDEILRKVSEAFMVKFVKLTGVGNIEEFIMDGEGEFPIIYIYENKEFFGILYTDDMRLCREDDDFDFRRLELFPNMYSNLTTRIEILSEHPAEIVEDTNEKYNTVSHSKPTTYQIPLPEQKKEASSEILDDLLNVLEAFSEAYESHETKNSEIINKSKKLLNEYGEFNDLHAFSKLSQYNIEYAPEFNKLNPASNHLYSSIPNLFQGEDMRIDSKNDSAHNFNNYNTLKPQKSLWQTLPTTKLCDLKTPATNNNQSAQPLKKIAADPLLSQNPYQAKFSIQKQGMPIEVRCHKQDLGFSTVQPNKFKLENKPYERKTTNKYCEYEKKFFDESLFIDLSCKNCSICNNCRLKNLGKCIMCDREYSDYEISLLSSLSYSTHQK